LSARLLPSANGLADQTRGYPQQAAIGPIQGSRACRTTGVEQRLQGASLDELPQLHQGLVVGDTAGVDAAEPAIHQAAGDLAAQRLVAPLPHVLEHQHPQHHLGRRAVATPATALGVSPAQDRHHLIDQALVLEQKVHPPEHGVHQGLGLGQRRAEKKELCEGELSVAASNHLHYRSRRTDGV